MATEEEKGLPFEPGWQFPTLTTKQAASKMLEPSNASNAKFLQTQIMEGKLPEDAVTGSPPPVLRIAKKNATRTGVTPLGTGSNTTKSFKPSPRLGTFIPHVDDFPASDTSKGNTDGRADGMLTRDIAMGSFMGGNAVNALPEDVNPYNLARNLHMQAEILRAARSRPEFSGYSIEVDEGVYKYEKREEKTEGSLAALASEGRAIGYKVYKFDGKESPRKLFELGEYLMTYPFYEKIIMEYNTYGGGAGARLFVCVPDMSGDIHGTSFPRQTETVFNGKTMSGSLMLLDVVDDETVEDLE